jgi:hypothetical protein
MFIASQLMNNLLFLIITHYMSFCLEHFSYLLFLRYNSKKELKSMKKIILVILMMFCCAFLITCGKETKTIQREESVKSEPVAMSQAHDPCDLIKVEDMQQYFPGQEIKITRHDAKANAVGQKICYWSASEAEMKFVQLSISSNADMKSGSVKVDELYENEKQMLDQTQPVSEIGDSAYYGGSGLKMGAGLHVLLKDKGVKLTIMVGLGTGNADDQKHIDIETALAKKVIERL